MLPARVPAVNDPARRDPPRRHPQRREIVLVGPCAWSDLGVTAAAWPECELTQIQREADALAHLSSRAVDVVVTSPTASASRVMNIARRARTLQPGVRVIVLAADLAQADILDALRSQVYATFTLPVAADDLGRRSGRRWPTTSGRAASR